MKSTNTEALRERVEMLVEAIKFDQTDGLEATPTELLAAMLIRKKALKPDEIAWEKLAA